MGDTTVRTVAHLSGTGVWSFELRHFDPGEVADAASELEALGYSALWICRALPPDGKDAPRP